MVTEIKILEHFWQASGIATKSEKSQTNTLNNIMGQKADIILKSFYTDDNIFHTCIHIHTHIP